MTKFNIMTLKADFHSVESSERTGNLLFTIEIVALNLNKMLRVTDLLLCLFLSARKNSAAWKSALRGKINFDV